MEFLLKIVSTINPWLARWLTRRDEERGIWRARQISPTQLRSEDLLVDRDFRDYFFRRPEDDLIQGALDEGKNVLVLGESLSGKTRAVYEALRKLPRIYWLYLFRKNLTSLDKYHYPGRPKDGYRRFFVIEDLQSFVKVPNFATVLSDAIEHRVQIVATCQSGIEREGVVKQLGDKGLSLEFLFDSTYVRGTTIKLGEIRPEKAKQIASDVGIAQYHFNGMIGSIFEPLYKMQQRYVSCSGNEKNVLITLKELYDCGLMRSGFRCSLIWIERALATNKRCITSVTLSGVVEQLARLEFLTYDSRNQQISVKEAYLKYVAEYPEGIVAPTTLQLFHDLVSANDTDPEALKLLGDRIYVVAQKPEHFKKMAELGVSCRNRAVELSAGAPPHLLAGRQVDLGIALQQLAEVADTNANCRAAIDAFWETLKVYMPDSFPMDYAMIQNNLGNAFGILADVEDKATNCRAAINAYREALKVYTPDSFPMDYAMTQNNLGNAFQRLAAVEDKASNCRAAINAYREALKVYTLDSFPMQYAMTQNNLGAAFQTLAEAEDKTANCRAAINAYREALKVYTPDSFLMQYAATQNNLGNAFRTLAEVERDENCRQAERAFREAMNVYTEDQFPEIYLLISKNLEKLYRFWKGE